MKDTAIEWADDTFNPWWGCTKVSPGCTHCYAESMSRRFGKDVWGPGKERRRTSAEYWSKRLVWDRQPRRDGEVLKRGGERRLVFSGSMCDVFDPAPPTQWRGDFYDLIRKTRNTDWMLLTKRPVEINSLGAPPKKVWLGTSVEDQRRADERIPELIAVPAAIHFLSVEPLLEAVKLNLQEIDWVIVGGESGPRARPMDIEWARALRDQCTSAGVAFFMKQLGGYPDKRHQLSDFPADLRIREFPTGGQP